MKIYYLPITQPEMSETDYALLKYVSSDRQHKIQKYHFEIDKKLSLYAKLLAKKCISTTLPMPLCDIHIQQKDLHKPVLTGSFNIDFSYSHTRSAILLGITFHGKIGVDIEALSDNIPECLHQFFHEQEINYIQKAAKPETAFFEIWTKKEAYTKYLGVGLSANLPAINTLSKSFAPHFQTWQQDTYICSVYSDEPCSLNTSFSIMHEADIRNFFFEHLT